MASAFTSPQPLSPSFSTGNHFQWPAHSHSHYHFAPSSPDQHSFAFELPELSSSFVHLSHTAAFAAAGELSSPDSPGVDAKIEPAALYSLGAPFPSLSSLSSSSTSPSSPASSLYSSTPSPTAKPDSAQFHSGTSTANERQQTSNRRRRRQAQEAAEEQQQQHAVDSDSDSTQAARRVKHRQIDAARRAREQTAISRLLQLTQRLTHIAYFDQQHATPAKRRRAAAESKKDKVSVLEEAADRMEALYELIEELGAACLHQYDNARSRVYQPKHLPQNANNRDAHILSLLPTRCALTTTSPPLASGSKSSRMESATFLPSPGCDNSHHSLYSIFFLSASLPMLTVRCDTGQILDVNSKVLALSGWAAQHMIGKRITAPYDLIMSTPPKSCTEMKVALCGKDFGNAVLVEDKDGQMGHAKAHEQYEASNDLERRLYSGEVSVIQAVWRLQLRDGRLHELTATQWCGEWVEVPDGKGGLRRQPTYVVYVISPESIIRLD